MFNIEAKDTWFVMFFVFQPRQRGRNKSHPKGQWVDVVRKSDLFEQYYKV